MAQKLTERQQEILDLIIEHVEASGIPPTRVEIAEHFGFRSPNAAEEHLRALERKGAIEMIPGASRGIRVPNMGVPIIGRVAAGQPILAEENVHDHCDIKSTMFPEKPDFMLQVEGDSMVNAGIFDGDLLAVKKTNRARNGQIIVARIGDDVTVKRFQKSGKTIQLIAENDNYDPIVVDLQNEPFEIEGLGVGIVRQKLA